MKKRLFPLFIFLLFVSCNKIQGVTKFHLKMTNATSIPATININLPFNILTPNIETNIEKELSVHNSAKNLIEHVELQELTLSSNNQPFDFLKSIEIYITAEGLSDVLIASKQNITDNVGKTLDLDETTIDLKEYIKKDKITIKIKVITDQILTQKCNIDIFTDFFVDAKILGL